MGNSFVRVNRDDPPHHATLVANCLRESRFLFRIVEDCSIAERLLDGDSTFAASRWNLRSYSVFGACFSGPRRRDDTTCLGWRSCRKNHSGTWPEQLTSKDCTTGVTAASGGVRRLPPNADRAGAVQDEDGRALLRLRNQPAGPIAIIRPIAPAGARRAPPAVGIRGAGGGIDASARATGCWSN
jgi:hypothetical protein